MSRGSWVNWSVEDHPGFESLSNKLTTSVLLHFREKSELCSDLEEMSRIVSVRHHNGTLK